MFLSADGLQKGVEADWLGRRRLLGGAWLGRRRLLGGTLHRKRQSIREGHTIPAALHEVADVPVIRAVRVLEHVVAVEAAEELERGVFVKPIQLREAEDLRRTWESTGSGLARAR